MFGSRLITFNLGKSKKLRRMPKKDAIVEQVKKVLEDTDQKLILMARG